MNHIRRPSRRRRGLTVVEVVISTAIGSLVLGAAAVVTTSGSRTQCESVSRIEGDARAERAIGVIARPLTGAAMTSVTGPVDQPGSWSDAITFDRSIGLDPATGRPQWSPLRIMWVLAPGEKLNGRDDDGNGLVDEGEVVQVNAWGTKQAQTVVLATGVRRYAEGARPNGEDDNGNGLADECGLSFQRSGDTIVVRLSLDVPSGTRDGKWVVHATEARVFLRNQ